ncbi:A-kinase anchor protein 9-like [Cricetulus griseus]|uniref:A-kinase anchor protein 9-like n=1 Tax=Cricetulus griseus TaxID=10029 RepID=A0A9J7K9Z8_CRIGR|nr:A-kinase anchor protein 9-like [Cricetulus griseus]
MATAAVVAAAAERDMQAMRVPGKLKDPEDSKHWECDKGSTDILIICHDQLNVFGQDGHHIDDTRKRISLASSHSEEAAHCSPTHVEMTENDLAGKQHEIEELTQQLEGMRAIYGTEVLQRVSYEFEAAIKKRDSIITRLAANMQQSRKKTDQILEEFFQLTERSEKVQIQEQHVLSVFNFQARETLQRSPHSSAAAELVLLKQQVHDQQQLLEQQYRLLKDSQKKEEEFKNEVTFLQERLKVYEMVKLDVSWLVTAL